MVKHDDLMQQTVLHAEGYLFAIDNRHPKFPIAICETAGMNPEYVNLMAAAALLYRSAGEAIKYMEALIDYLDAKQLDEAVPSVVTVQATLDSAMKIAIEGLPKNSQKTA